MTSFNLKGSQRQEEEEPEEETPPLASATPVGKAESIRRVLRGKSSIFGKAVDNLQKAKKVHAMHNMLFGGRKKKDKKDKKDAFSCTSKAFTPAWRMRLSLFIWPEV